MYIYKEKIKVFGEPDQNTLDQMMNCYQDGVVDAVLAADSHKGYSQPIGGIVAYRDKISISGIGFDQHCGCLGIQTDIDYKDIKNYLNSILDDVQKNISFGVGRTNNHKIDHELFDHPIWNVQPFSDWKTMAYNQLGTVGSGNHYLDILVDETSKIWVGVHFGSRGLGHKTATYFLNKAGGKDGMDVPPTTVDVDSELGQFFLSALDLTSKYAYAGREWVARFVVTNILKGRIIKEIHNHHNAVWLEEHHGEKLWVVRKGATPAFPDQYGFIGGSMGDNAVIIKGVDSELSRQALYSTVHGAGRVMSRTQARGKINRKTGEVISQGQISPQDMHYWLKSFGVVLRGEIPMSLLRHIGDWKKFLNTMKEQLILYTPSSLLE